jgi:hypothetical protein
MLWTTHLLILLLRLADACEYEQIGVQIIHGIPYSIN